MAAEDERRPYIDPQSLTDADLAVYEAIATLEQAGQPPTGQQVAAATTHLDDQTIAQILRKLLARGVVVHASGGSEPTYTLPRHDWSSVPG